MKLIRDYVKTQIKKELPGSSELDAAFDFHKILTGKQKDHYHLEFGDFAPIDGASGQYFTDEVALTLRLLKQTKKASVADFDDASSQAIGIRKEVAKHANFAATSIARVVPGPITIQEYERNPETIETVINFTFEVAV